MTVKKKKPNKIMMILENLGIRKKIFLLIAIPMFVILFTLFGKLTDKLHDRNEAVALQKLIHYANEASSLAHEFQKERGATAGYIGSKGKKMSDVLSSQKMDTDKILARYNNFISEFDGSSHGDRFYKDYNDVNTKIKRLNEIREKVVSLDISKGDAIKYYTSIMAAMSRSFDDLSLLTNSRELSGPITAAVSFFKVKEMAGIERARMSGITAANKPIAPKEYLAWMDVWKGQETLVKHFFVTASPDIVDYYNKIMVGKIIEDVDKIRYTLVEKASTGNFMLEPSDVFAMATKRINLLRKVETKQAKAIKDIAEDIQIEAQNSFLVNAVMGALIITVVLLFSLLVSRIITRPIQGIVATLKDIAQGEGDLTVRLNIESKDELGDLGKWFDIFVEKLQMIIISIQQSAKEVANASENITASTEVLATGAEEQQAQISEVAAAVEETSVMITETSNHTTDTQQSAGAANIAAEAGREKVEETIKGMESIAVIVKKASDQISLLKTRTEEIGIVVQVIDEISDQTNLLALNANIEAARAGDAGRGFAVVADEVRKLAERTVSATADISKKIELIHADMSDAVVAMSEIASESERGEILAGESGNSINEISMSIQQVNEAMAQIANASNEQSIGVETISRNIEGVSIVAKEAAVSAQDLATTVEHLDSEVSSLSEMVNQFKV